MHIEYDTTPEEFADAHLRLQARSKMARRTRWQATAWVAVLTGLLLYLLLTLRGASPTERATVAALGSVLAAGSYALRYRGNVKRRAIEYMREQFQSDDPIPFSVELREDCIWVKQGPTQLSFDWEGLSDVIDSGDAIELRMRNGGIVVVRNRGFATKKERGAFLHAAEARIHQKANRPTDAPQTEK